MFEHVPCAVCGADDYEVLFGPESALETDTDFAAKFRASGDELLVYALVRCRGCEFQYVNPRPRADLIYSGYMEGDDPTYVSQISAREQTFAASLEQIERAAGGKGRLLDVGTAAGAFVATARQRGWDAEGCEPNRWLSDWGSRHYGICIRNGDLLQLDYKEGSFDVITLWDVIEHTTDPRRVLERCRALMRPNGILVVNYPDIGTWIARLLGRRWPFLTSVHLSYFDRRTIRQILEKTGYDVEAVKPHVQRLELDYILFRGSVLSRTASAATRMVVKGCGLSRLKVPYWLGQTLVIARKLALLVSTNSMYELILGMPS
jgi:SAM-dependent methyltransferase